jgi:hypothetical protein
MKFKPYQNFHESSGVFSSKSQDCYFQQKYKFSNLNLLKPKEKNPFIQALN